MEFSFSINPSSEYSGLISFRIDRFDLLSVKGTLKSLLQHHSLKASILWCSAFFIVQRSHPYMTTGKTIALTRWTSVGKVISLLINMLSRLVITFLTRSKRLLISWLQSPSAVILEPKHPASCIEPGLATRFLHDILHVSLPFSQISPPSPSPTESIRLFYTSVSLLLSRTPGYCYHLSKYHIYALVYCIYVFPSGLLHSA